MKSRLFAVALLLLLSCREAKSIEVGGTGGFYYVNLKNQKSYRTGYELWKGKKNGFFYHLFISNRFKIGKDEFFKLSVISGTTKLPFDNVFTPIKDRLTPFYSKTFDMKELFFQKENFILENLTLTAGKSRFKFSPVFDDYLWGGKFSYKIKENLSFNYYQIAGFEGIYLLPEGKSEDDVDIFGPEIVWEKGNYTLSLAAIRISNAKGNKAGTNKNNLIAQIKGQNKEFNVATQNGNWGVYGKWKNKRFKIEGCAFEKGFTSYGYREGIPNFGVIYHPAVSDLKALRIELKEGHGWFKFLPYVTVYNKRRIEGGGKLLMGTESNKIFLTAAVGDENRWGIFTGYSWRGTPQLPFKKIRISEVKVKNYFDVVGEYADFSKHYYETQSGYEGWNTAKHVGYWHSTYKLSIYGSKFSVKISTGRNSKVDYVIWGNTVDNFLYQEKTGKQWHFENAYLTVKPFTIGLQNLKIPGFIDENLSGIKYASKTFHWGTFLEKDEGNTVKYLFAQIPLNSVTFSGLFREKKGEKNIVAGLEGRSQIFAFGILREWNKYGDEKNKGWGGFIKIRKLIKNFKFNALYEVYSEDFKTFDMKEFFRNVSYIYRPGESNVRFFSLSIKRKVKTNIKKIDRLKPEIGLIYNKLNRFSGSFVGEEEGITISLKPGKFCNLSFIGTVGTNQSYYEGLQFQIKW